MKRALRGAGAVFPLVAGVLLAVARLWICAQLGIAMAHADIAWADTNPAPTIIRAQTEIETEPNDDKRSKSFLPRWVGELFSSDLEFEIVNTRNETTKFRIPKAYITYLEHPGGGRQRFIEVTGYLPDLLARDAAVKAGYQVTKRIHGYDFPADTQVVIMIRDAIPGVIQGLLDFNLPWMIDAGKKDGELKIYYSRIIQGSPPQIIPDLDRVILMPPDRDDAYLETNSYSRNRDTFNFSLYTLLTEKVMLQIIFSARRLDQWREIESATKALIKSFVIP